MEGCTIYGYKNSRKEAFEARNLDVKDIAKLIRKDLKKAYPDIKISTTISRGGINSIRCEIKQIPLKYLKDNDEYHSYAMGKAFSKWYDNDIALKEANKDLELFNDIKKGHGHCYKEVDGYNYKYHLNYGMIKENVMNDLTKIHDAYNYDNSDIMVDYFEVGYCGNVSIDYDVIIVD